MTGSTRVLVKVVLFQLRGRGHPQDNVKPNLFLDSKGPLLDLSNEKRWLKHSKCFPEIQGYEDTCPYLRAFTMIVLRPFACATIAIFTLLGLDKLFL